MTGIMSLELLLAISCMIDHINTSKLVHEDLFEGRIFLQWSRIKPIVGQPVDLPLTSEWKQFTYYGIKYGNAKRWEPPTINTEYSYKYENRHHLYSWNWTAASDVGYRCHQPSDPVKNGARFDEDCLYLDIYVPPIKRNHETLMWKPFPVIVWIHGGAFQFGSKNTVTAEDLVRTLQAVVITIQYRLGPFGFLNVNNDLPSANLGLQDVKMAIKWIKSNIADFGGDIERIIIAGHEAGGAMVSAALLDMEIRKLIRGAVSMSGSVFGYLGNPIETKNKAEQLAEFLGCELKSSRTTVCLKSKTADEILTASLMVGMSWELTNDGFHIPIDPTMFLENQSEKFHIVFFTGFVLPHRGNSTVPHFQSLVQNELPALIRKRYSCTPTDDVDEMVGETLRFFKSYFRRGSWVKELHNQAASLPTILSVLHEARIYGNSELSVAGSQLYVISSDNFPWDAPQMPYSVKEPDIVFDRENQSWVSDSIFKDNFDDFLRKTSRLFRLMLVQLAHHGTGIGNFNSADGSHLHLAIGSSWRKQTDTYLVRLLILDERLRSSKCGRIRNPVSQKLVVPFPDKSTTPRCTQNPASQLSANFPFSIFVLVLFVTS